MTSKLPKAPKPPKPPKAYSATAVLEKGLENIIGDGSGLASILMSLIPKKKNIEQMIEILTLFSQYLKVNCYDLRTEETILVYDLFDHEFLKDSGVKLLEEGLLKCISYQEEIKIKKPKKDSNKGEVEEEEEEVFEVEISEPLLPEELDNSYYKSDLNFLESNKRKRIYEKNFKRMEDLQRPEILTLRKIASKCFFYLFSPMLISSVSSSYQDLLTKFASIDYRLIAYLIRLIEKSYEEINSAKLQKLNDLSFLKDNPPVAQAVVPVKGKDKEKDKDVDPLQILIDQETMKIEEKYINNSFSSLQTFIYSIKLLILFTKFSKNHYKKIIFKQKRFLFLLCNALQFHEKLIFPLAQFFSVIIPTLSDWRVLLSSCIDESEHFDNENEEVKNEEINLQDEKIKFLNSILLAISRCSDELHKLLPPPPLPELSAKDKKAASKKSKDPPPPEPTPTTDFYKDLEGTRMPKEVWYTATLHCLHIVLSSLALDHSIKMNLFHIDQFITSFSSYSFNMIYHKVNYFQDKCEDLDENIYNYFEFGISLIGKFSEKDDKIRNYFVKKEMIKNLQLILIDSRSIITPKIKKVSEDESNTSNEEKEKELSDEEKYYLEMKLSSLRKIIDKSILAILAKNNSSPLLHSNYLIPPLPTLENPFPICSIGLSSYNYDENELDSIFSQWTSLISEDFELPLRHYSIRQFASLIFSSSNSNNSEKLLEKIATSDSQIFSSICSYIDFNLHSVLENPFEIEESLSQDREEGDIMKINSNFSGITTLQGLFYSFHISMKFLNKLENFVLFIKQNRLDLLKQLLLISGSSTQNSTLSELKVTLYHPRSLSWVSLNEYQSSDNPYNLLDKFIEKKYFRPVIINVLSLCVRSFENFIISNELVTLEPLTQLPEITSGLRNEVYLIISTLSDIVFSMLQSFVNYNLFNNQKNGKSYLSISYLTDNLIPEELLVALIRFIDASGKSHCSGMCGVLETLSNVGFSEQINSSSFANLFNFLVSNTTSNQNSETENEVSFDYLSSPSSYKWKRPIYYEELGFTNETNLPSELSHLSSTPLLWPFLIIISPIISVLSNPLSSPLSINYSLSALESISNMKFFSSQNQPLFIDIIITLFLSFGGASSLLELNGIFGNKIIDKELVLSLIKRFYTHGRNREVYWKAIYDAQQVALAQIDPKAKGKKDEKPKDKKLSKADQKALANIVPPLFQDYQLNIEISERYNDPNHGPCSLHWKALLDISFDSHISKSKSSNLLISSILNNQIEISKLLIDQDIDINFQDLYGRTALMYSLLFNFEDLVKSLLSKDVLINLVDNSLTPTLFYSLCSKSYNFINENIFLEKDSFGPIYGNSPLFDLLLQYKSSVNNQDIFGGGPIDLLITDSNGYSPLLFSLGLGNIEIELFEKKFSFFNSAYSVDDYEIAPLFVKLYNAGANLDSCSKLGVVPLHVVSCIGDYDLVHFILTHGASANPLDLEKLHPIHYLLSSCPANVEKIFNLLLLKGNNRGFKQMIFSNERDNKTFNEKESLEVDNFFSLFDDVSLPKILTESRNLISNLLLIKSSEYMSEITPIFCAFAGHYFLKNYGNFDHFHERVLKYDSQNDPCSEFYKDRRSNIVKLILDKSKETFCIISLVNWQSFNNLNIIHAASLLFQGVSPRIELTPEQIRCKRIKYYESIELNILDIIYTNIQDYSYFSNISTYYSKFLPSTFYINNKNKDEKNEYVESIENISESSNVEGIENIEEEFQQPGELPGWSPLHATIYFGNFDFFQFLISLPTISMESLLLIHPVHLIASSCHNISDEFINFIISQCLLRQDATSLLINSLISYTFKDFYNKEHSYLATPLHIAIYNKKYYLIDKLSILPQIDLNKQAIYISSNVNEENQEDNQFFSLGTPIHFAVQYNDPLLIESLFSGKDKMDFTIKSYQFFSNIAESSKETCIDYVLKNKLYEILEQLVNMRKNDVLLHILSTDNEENKDGNSILYHLEKENFEYLTALKIPLILDFVSTENVPIEHCEPITAEPILNSNENHTDNEVSNDEGLKETQSIPILTNSPSSLFYHEDEEFEELPIVIKDPYYKLAPSHPFLSLSDDELKENLQKSNKVLLILLELVEANNFTDSSLHFHSMYSSNQLIYDL